MVIANSDEFTKRNLTKVGYVTNPLETDELSDYVVHSVAMTTLTLGAVETIGATKKDGQRAKNMFALGLLSWMYGRPIETSEKFIREKFARKPEVAETNVLALKAGWNYGETTEAFGTTYEVSWRPCRPANTARSRETPHWRTASSPLASSRTSRSCSAATRSRRPPTSCTSCPSTRTSTS